MINNRIYCPLVDCAGKEQVRHNPTTTICPLPAPKHCAIVETVTAKSVTRIETRQDKRRTTAQSGFFVPRFSVPARIMAGLRGLPSGRPVPVCAGSLNPFSPVAISRLRPWVTGSNKNTNGANTMAITCRLALLNSSTSNTAAPEQAVKHYRTQTYQSHQQARRDAQRLNAVVCAWTPARRATA